MPRQYARSLEPTFRRSEQKADDWSSNEKILEEGYTSLVFDSKLLLEEFQAIASSGSISQDDGEVVKNLQAIASGHVSAAVSLPQPLSVRELARLIVSSSEWGHGIIVQDFEEMITWITMQNPSTTQDRIRERLVKRKNLLEAALPESMQHLPAAAIKHIERDHFGKKYVNSETMLGDRIDEIPPERFFVSEDNYAWDMEELTQALSVNDGIMRNPFSKEMFSEADIRNILAHTLGQSLKPIRLAQTQLKRGLHSTTIDIIDRLGQMMLDDRSQDAAPSLRGIDEFLAHLATLPVLEQNTINSLKIPAKDRHTGQSYDYTIGESVRDGKSNMTCFHKVGDFLSQAAKFLRTQ